MLNIKYQLLSSLMKLIKPSIILLLVVLMLPSYAESINKEDKFKAGEHFVILRFTKVEHKHKINSFKEEFINDPEKPQVIMFFSYGCYGCWLINKKFHAWQQQNTKKIDFLLVPVALNPAWESLAKLYYLNQQLNPKYSNEIFFQQIHENHKPLWLEGELTKFYKAKNSKNIEPQAMLQLYHSFDIARKVEKSKIIADIYGIKVTPNFIVNINQHTYKTNFTMVDNIETVFRLVNYLIDNKPE